MHLLPRVWTPADTLPERVIRDRAPYNAWARAGQLVAVPRKTIDYDWAAMALAEEGARMNIRQINYDRWGIKRFQLQSDDIGQRLDLRPLLGAERRHESRRGLLETLKAA